MGVGVELDRGMDCIRCCAAVGVVAVGTGWVDWIHEVGLRAVLCVLWSLRLTVLCCCAAVRYTEVEMMVGDNQYKAEGYGLQVRVTGGGRGRHTHGWGHCQQS